MYYRDMAKNFTFHETAWTYSLLYIFWETTPPLVTGMLATGLKNILNRKFFVSSFFFLLYKSMEPFLHLNEI